MQCNTAHLCECEGKVTLCSAVLFYLSASPRPSSHSWSLYSDVVRAQHPPRLSDSLISPAHFMLCTYLSSLYVSYRLHIPSQLRYSYSLYQIALSWKYWTRGLTSSLLDLRHLVVSLHKSSWRYPFLFSTSSPITRWGALKQTPDE